MPEQRHPIFPSQVVSSPEDYPQPAPGPTMRWSLRTPGLEPVGILVFNDGGVSWTPARTEDDSAQEHAAEVLQYLRGNKAEGTSLADALAGIREAYTGDLAEAPGADARTEAWIQRQLATAPPLSDEQRARLARLLTPDTDSEGLALMADLDPDEAEGLAALAEARRRERGEGD